MLIITHTTPGPDEGRLRRPRPWPQDGGPPGVRLYGGAAGGNEGHRERVPVRVQQRGLAGRHEHGQTAHDQRLDVQRRSSIIVVHVDYTLMTFKQYA